jgi:chromosome segregation protein
MALSSKARSNGWLEQASRLAVTHGTWGTTPMAVAKRAQSSLTAVETEFDAAANEREIALADELEQARARTTGLERRLAQETAAKQTLSEQCEAADARIAELESELAAAHDELTLRGNESQSLQTSLDLTMAENAGLTERVAKSEATHQASAAQLEYLQTALTAAEAECTRLAGEASERWIETGTLKGRLEMTTARAETAERLLADARESLQARTADNAVAERNLAAANAVRRDAENEVRQVQDLLRLKQYQINELEQSRLKLIAATNALLKTFQNRDAALVHADDEIKLLNARIMELEAELQQANSQREKAEADAQSRRQAMTRIVADDPGEKARKKLVALARELAKLVKHKHQLATPGHAGATPTLLANTITF